MTFFLLFLSSFLAATFVPFSSELHFAAIVEKENLWLAVVFATAGNTLGGMLTYLLGWLAKWDWIEKYCRVKRRKIQNFQKVIQKYGGWMGLLTWMPVIGDVIAIGLGIFRSNPIKVLIAMALGKGIRYLVIGMFFY
ncbi:MAG: membrane protein YqaA with SNARE-associated domain [Flavobacteriales bacterium]|jgi:membrane protein YqaA with SNARE-associated domain|tara:strand:+ start:5816 stop:6226 length:411 start_codon:yes stop_codon:yes gene_type:complete